MRPVSCFCTTTSFNAATTSQQFLGTTGGRCGGTVANNSSAVLYVLLGNGTASSSNFSVALVGNANGISYYELPFNYIGPVQGAWATATGQALVTELT